MATLNATRKMVTIMTKMRKGTSTGSRLSIMLLPRQRRLLLAASAPLIAGSQPPRPSARRRRPSRREAAVQGVGPARGEVAVDPVAAGLEATVARFQVEQQGDAPAPA